MRRTHFRPLLILVAIAVLLTACSSSDDPDPGPPPTPKMPLMITDLGVVKATGISLTLGWTSPNLVDKASIRYDLRHIAYGAEHLDWDQWTVAPPPQSDTASGTARTHEVVDLESGEVYVFRMIATTDGVDWSGFSNLAVATVGRIHDTTAPAAVTDLFRYKSTSTSLTMAWPFAGDDGVYGKASDYLVRYATSPITVYNWASATPVPGSIFESALSGLMETSITDLDPGQEYHVAVIAIDDHSNHSELSKAVASVTAETRTVMVNAEGTGDYPTIEAAINNAVAGDVIMVEPGRYTWENQGTGDALLGMINVPRDFSDFEVRSVGGPEVTILDAQENGKVMSVTGGSSGTAPDFEYAGITITGFTFTGGRAMADSPNPVEGWSGAGLNLHLTDTVVRNCIFTGNEATEGGGLWVGGQGDALIEDCLFEENKARVGGGILLVNSAPRITVRNCRIQDNEALLAGGGIYAVNVLMTLENLLVAGNKSSSKGGGISVSGLNEGSEVVSCTVVDNHGAIGSGFRIVENTTLHVKNCLVADNTGSAAFSFAVVGKVELRCSLIFGHSPANFPDSYSDQGGNLELDPAFCDRINYRLQGDSVCLPDFHPAGPSCGVIGAQGVGCGF